MRGRVCCVVLMVSVAACSHPSSTTYGDTEVGQAIETAPGSIVSSRIVNVSDEPGLLGASAGAAVGAVGGNLAVAGPVGLLVAIVGGLVGAGIGYMAEKQMKDGDGIEYVLEMDDGRLVTLVQNRESGEQPLPDRARVLIQLNSQYTRVMAHPAVDYNAGGGLGRPRRRHCASARCRGRRHRAGRKEPSVPARQGGRTAGYARAAVDQHHRFRPAAVSGHYRRTHPAYRTTLAAAATAASWAFRRCASAMACSCRSSACAPACAARAAARVPWRRCTFGTLARRPEFRLGLP
jgi:outer membrane lipoprotein SlyB